MEALTLSLVLAASVGVFSNPVHDAVENTFQNRWYYGDCLACTVSTVVAAAVVLCGDTHLAFGGLGEWGHVTRQQYVCQGDDPVHKSLGM